VFLLSNEHNSLGTQCGMRKAGCAGCGMCRKPFQSVERFRYSSDRHQVIAHALYISRNTSRGKNREDKNGHLRTERLPLSDLESTRAVAKFSQSRVWNKVSVRSDLIFWKYQNFLLAKNRLDPSIHFNHTIPALLYSLSLYCVT